MKKNYLIPIFLTLSIFLLLSCGLSKEEKINDAFLEDSLQYEQTKLLKQSNQEALETLEIDTAMNNINSKDPAIPVFDDKN